MIVPENRLLLLVAVGPLPLSIMAATMPGMAPLALGLCAALALIVALDAALAPRRARGFALELPDLTRMTRGSASGIDFHLANHGSGAARVTLALLLPQGLESDQETLLLGAPPVGMRIPIRWPAFPVKRGRHYISEARLETASPLGFWMARARLVSPRSEVRVYPDLLGERRAVAAVFLNRGGLGAHTVRQIGKGHEFEKLREYTPGDSFEDIHWKATGRRAHPITKVFQIERTQEVYIAIDASRLSGRMVRDVSTKEADPDGPAPLTPLLDRCVRAGLVLAMAAERQGDKSGLIVFNDRVQTFIPAGSGQAHYGRIRDALYTLEPRRVAPDFGEFFRFLRLRLNRRALVITLTSLDDPGLAESFAREIELVCRRHVMLVNMVAPRRATPIFDAESPVGSTAEIYQRLAGGLLRENLRRLEITLGRRGVRFSILRHDLMVAELVTQYLNVKQRQVI